MILIATLSLIQGALVIAYVLLTKNIMKKAMPILGFLSIALIALTIILLSFIDSQLLYMTLIGSFTAFCVLMPINAFLIQKNKNDSYSKNK